jgi:hypothetical protein
MYWQRKGQIFSFQDSELREEFASHTVSPQALIFPDFVRVYFCTRRQDSEGRYVSHVRYVDFDKDFRRVIAIARRDVLGESSLGAFDEHGIFPFSPLRHEGKLFGYTTGWSRRVSVDVALGIGVATSIDNGETFKRLGTGPVLTASLHEPFLVCDGSVLIADNTFNMFYIFGTNWKQREIDSKAERTYVIGHATSTDGMSWRKGGRQLIECKFKDECQALPTVVKIQDTYHMFFCYRPTFDFRATAGRGYRIGHAYSADLQEWVRDDDNGGLDVSRGGWDSEMVCYPNVFECDGNFYMLYNGNAFGRDGFGLAELIH